MADLKNENEGLREDLRNVKLDKVNADEKGSRNSKKLDELHTEELHSKQMWKQKDDAIKRLQKERNEERSLKQSCKIVNIWCTN